MWYNVPMLALVWYMTCYGLTLAGGIAILARFRREREPAAFWLLWLLGGFTLISLSLSLGSTLGRQAGTDDATMVLNLLSLLTPAVFLAALPRFVRCFVQHPGQRVLVTASTVFALSSLSMTLLAMYPGSSFILWGLFVPHAVILVAVVFYSLAVFRRAVRGPQEGQPDPGPFWRRFLGLVFWITLALFPLAIGSDLFQLPRHLAGVDLPRFMPCLAAAVSIAFLAAQTRDGASASPVPVASLLADEERAAVGKGPAAGLAAFGLSPREAEVADLLLEGLSYQAIGERLFVSAGTVKTHVLNVYKKTGVRTKIALLHLAQSGSASSTER